MAIHDDPNSDNFWGLDECNSFEFPSLSNSNLQNNVTFDSVENTFQVSEGAKSFLGGTDIHALFPVTFRANQHDDSRMAPFELHAIDKSFPLFSEVGQFPVVEPTSNSNDQNWSVQAVPRHTIIETPPSNILGGEPMNTLTLPLNLVSDLIYSRLPGILGASSILCGFSRSSGSSV